MMCNNPNLGLFNINAYTKFGKRLNEKFLLSKQNICYYKQLLKKI